MGGITDLAMGFPLQRPHPEVVWLRERGPAPERLRHLRGRQVAPGSERGTPRGAPRDRWPLGQGFERYYGFLGAETNQFAPDITIDNTIQRPVERRDGYHLSEDLIDRAVEMVDDLRNGEPTKPFFMYLAFGACHSPHQAPPSYIEAYRGRSTRVGRLARAHAPAPDRDGHHPARHRAVRAARLGAGVGLAARPGEDDVRPDDGGVRSDADAHRPPDRASRRVPP